MENLMDWLLRLLGVPSGLEGFSFVVQHLLGLIPFVFGVAVIIGVVAFTSRHKTEEDTEEDTEELTDLDLEISRIKDSQRK